MTIRGRVIFYGLLFAIACTFAGDRVARAGFCYSCGGNSATVGDKIVFDELNVNGLARPGGPKIVAAILNGAPVTLRVERHFLGARQGARTFVDSELRGLIIKLQMDDGRAYELQLSEICSGKDDRCKHLTFWVKPDEGIPTYSFKVKKTHRRNGVPDSAPDDRNGDDRRPDDSFKEHLCKGEFRQDDTLWKDFVNTAIAFEGDHYDDQTKTVQEVPTRRGWFNLACAGSAVFKMHMLRHTRAGSITPDATPRSTTIGQRTAMLKAITADYCGDGKAWTADGTPLSWKDSRGWFVDPALDVNAAVTAGQVEGVWGPKGALCLNVPRRLPNATVSSSCTAPAVRRSEVRANCAWAGRKYLQAPPSATSALPAMTPSIPHCTKEFVDWFRQAGATAYVLTANRPKPADYCDPP